MPAPSPEAILERLRTWPLTAAVLALVGQDDAPRVALVGGAVRDLLLDQMPVDVDLVVEGAPAPLARALGGAQAGHDRFETATVQTAEGRVDLARARTETYAAPGALPAVRAATIEDDLARRDFTINAIAVQLSDPGAGVLIAHPDALADLGARRLAVLHERSFRDDPTRLLRLARYRARLGFEIAAETRALAAAAVTDGALATVSGDRVGNELRLLAAEADPVAAFESLAEVGLDAAIEAGFGIADRAPLLRDALAVLPPDGRRDLLALAVAALSIPRPRLTELLNRLAFTAPDRAVILDSATNGPALAAALADATSGSQIATAVRGSTTEAIALSSALASGVVRARAIRWLRELRHIRPEVNGDDLIAAGLEPGPAIGRGLRAAHAALLDGEAPDRDSQLAVALGAAHEPGETP